MTDADDSTVALGRLSCSGSVDDALASAKNFDVAVEGRRLLVSSNRTSYATSWFKNHPKYLRKRYNLWTKKLTYPAFSIAKVKRCTATDMRPLPGNSETKKFLGHKQNSSVLAAVYNQASRCIDIADHLGRR